MYFVFISLLFIFIFFRDCRGGKGEKTLFHKCLHWLCTHHPDAIEKNLHHIPYFGCWRDLLVLIGTEFEKRALGMFADRLKKDLQILESIKQGNKSNEKVSLAAKWAPSERHAKDVEKAALKLAKLMYPKSKSPLKEYRKLCLVPLREHLRLTERFMSSKNWSGIQYETVPSRCMNKFRKAFAKNDSTRFTQFLGKKK